MRKIICLSILIASVGVLLTAMNQSFVNMVKQDRYFAHLNPVNADSNSIYRRFFIRSDRWRYGDLYGLCFLSKYKFKLEPFKAYPRDERLPLAGRILYIIGDSYLADKVLNGAFKGFDNVIFLDRRFPFGPIKLDSTKQNYLIMEFAERNLIDYNIDKTDETKWTRNDIKEKSNYNITLNTDKPNTNMPTTLSERLFKILFNKDLSRNLELLLFDDKIFTPVKELKAFINYNLTGRLPKEVAVSTDKKRLLMNLTVDTSYRQSDFRTIPDSEVKQLIKNLNVAKQYYHAIGFREVMLSVIPNTASICDFQRLPYNHLLQRVELNNKFPVISVFDTFKRTQNNLFYRSDTHWNPIGLATWIGEANRKLNAQSN